MTAPAAVRIRSAAGLFEAFESDDLGLHLAMLGAVAREPDRALAYGRHGERDVVDVMLGLLNRRITPPHQIALFEALTRFHDSRVAHECRRRFAFSGPAELRRLAALALPGQDPDGAYRFLAPWLLQDRDTLAATLAAQALAGDERLSPREQIRVAVAAPEAECGPLPPFGNGSADFWLRELGGPFAEGARLRLMEGGAEAYSALKHSWGALTEADRCWLLEWGVRAHPLEVFDLLKRGIEGPESQVALAALRLLPRLGPAGELFRPLLSRFRESADPELVHAAIAAGLRGLDWRALIQHPESRRLALTAILRLAEAEGEAALPDLVGLLASPEWRVRSTAARAIISLGVDAASAVRALLDDPRDEVRTAATQVLLSLGKEDWIPGLSAA